MRYPRQRLGVLAVVLTAIVLGLGSVGLRSYRQLHQFLRHSAQVNAIAQAEQIAQILDRRLPDSPTRQTWTTLIEAEGLSPYDGELFWQGASGQIIAAPTATPSPAVLQSRLQTSPQPGPLSAHTPLPVVTIAGRTYYVLRVPLASSHTLIQVIPRATLNKPLTHLHLVTLTLGGLLLISVGSGVGLLLSCWGFRQERQRLQDLITHAPLPVALFDRQMRYLAYSDEWAKDVILVGPAQREPLLGQSYLVSLSDTTALPHQLQVVSQSPCSLVQFWQRLHERALQGERRENLEEVILHPEGSKIYLHWAVYPWHHPNGTIGGTVFAIDRIDELVQAREAALDVARMKSQFLANMSHEIRTPISGVLGMADLLCSTQLSPKQQEFVNNLNSSAQHLLSIVNNILDFSKLEAGEMQLEQVKFDLYSCIEEVVDVLAHQFERKRIELAVFIGLDVPRQLQGDPGRLRQILLNLMGNAAKFTAADGEVSIRVAQQANNGKTALLRFEVKDTGVGIAPEAQAKLFQAFFQGDATTSRRYGGTGLGLAISKQLVERMGGTIGCQSQLGKGTTFWFTVKLGIADEEWVPTLPSVLAGLKLLVVDPTPAVRQSLRSLLRGWGVKTIDDAADAPAALECLRQARQQGDAYDVAIIEFQLPWMDGETLVRTITADPELAATRLVLMTSVGEQEHAERLLKVGLASYSMKPLRATRLLDALLRALRVALPGARERSLRHLETIAPASRLPWGEPAALESTLAACPAPAAEPPPSPPALPAHLRILLVEDHPVNQEVLLTQLELLGYPATLATNGQEALRILEQQPYDLVLMDCQMPILDGYATTRALRQLEERQQAKRAGTPHRAVVIALTAHALPTDRQRCLAAGMDDYLSKPVSKADLVRMLERWTAAGRFGLSAPDTTTLAPRDSLPQAIAQTQANTSENPGRRSPSAPLGEARGGVRSEERAVRSEKRGARNTAGLPNPRDIRPPLNLDRLRELFYKKPLSLQKFLRLFLENAQADVAGLQQAIAQLSTPNQLDAAYDRLIHYSHRLKGSSANAGATQLADLAAQLHAAAQQRNSDACQTLLAKVTHEFTQVCQFADTVLQTPSEE